MAVSDETTSTMLSTDVPLSEFPLAEVLMTSANESGIGAGGECALYETYTLVRFVYIVLATAVAIGGFGCNILLLVIFAKRSCATTPHTLYPSALALVDAVICASYTLMFGADAIISYLRIESLFVLYYLYIIPAFVISRIAQLAVPYMLIFATLERLNWISERRKVSRFSRIYSREGRIACVAATFAVCLLVRLPTAWAIEVAEYPECADFFRTLTTASAEWTEDNELWYFFDFHILVIAQTVLPFIVLIFLNAIIVHRLRRVNANIQREEAAACIEAESTKSMEGNGKALAQLPPTRSTQSQMRSAIITMAAIVTSYLICNSLHLVLTILERSHASILMDADDPLLSSTFHTSFSDLISFVYMFTSGIRLFIYAAVNSEVRRDLFALCRSTRPQRVPTHL